MAARPRPPSPPRVTIVEDDENVAGLLAFLLEREGFVPDVLRDGRAALAHVASHPPPLAVVLDHMLPYRDGLQVATAIRADARWRDVPILLLSAAQGEPAARAGAARVDAWFEKPFDPAALLSILRRLTREAA